MNRVGRNYCNWLFVDFAKLIAVVALALFLVTGCRGGDGVDTVPAEKEDFVVTPDPDRFLRFLNIKPGAQPASTQDNIDNFDDFPTAYYNTIDPLNSRTTLEDWQLANGFLVQSGNLFVEPACDAVDNCCVPEMTVTNQCKVVSAHVKFRNTKDTGYGRDMYLRHTRLGKNAGQIAMYIRNFKVDKIEGLPYGPLNLQAMVNDDKHWQFGVNAIEFSTYPYGEGEPSSSVVDALQVCSDAQSDACAAMRNRKFSKFYNFAGDGKLVAGTRNTHVDLDERGSLPMPTPCLTCHGGRGTTAVSQSGQGELKLLATLPGELPGDLHANLTTLEIDTLEFSSKPGYTKDENLAGLQAINEAVLASYKEHKRFLALRTERKSGYWDPSFAISLLEGRLANGNYDHGYIPTGWQTESADLFTDFVAPHCLNCHVLQGSGLNSSLTFSNSQIFQDYSPAIDHLVFQAGLMPAGLWNYREFWDLKNPLPIASVLGLPRRVQQSVVQPPGAPIARISAPLVESKMAQEIIVQGGGSAFATRYEWSISPQDATITGQGATATIALPENPADVYTVTLSVSNNQHDCTPEDSPQECRQDWRIQLSENSVLPNSLCDVDGVNSLLQNNCVGCHSDNSPFPAIPVVFADVCESGLPLNEMRDRHRKLLTRVNLYSPLDSLLLRKPTNGAANLAASDSGIADYHAGGLISLDARDISTIINWINRGAQPQ